MKKQLNEIKRMQQLAGILKEDQNSDQEWTLEKIKDLWRGITGNPELDVEEMVNGSVTIIVARNISLKDRNALAMYYKSSNLLSSTSQYIPGSKDVIYIASMSKVNLINFEKQGRVWSPQLPQTGMYRPTPAKTFKRR